MVKWLKYFLFFIWGVESLGPVRVKKVVESFEIAALLKYSILMFVMPKASKWLGDARQQPAGTRIKGHLATRIFLFHI